MSRRNWSRQETLMALAFYLCPPLPRKNWDDSDAEIRLLAGEIGRTESAVCFKIANLKACDPNRTGLGFTNAAGMDRQVTSEYLADPDATMSEAMWELEQIGIRISYDGEIETSGSSRPDQPQQLGLERVERVRTRGNQGEEAAGHNDQRRLPQVRGGADRRPNGRHDYRPGRTPRTAHHLRRGELQAATCPDAYVGPTRESGESLAMTLSIEVCGKGGLSS